MLINARLTRWRDHIGMSQAALAEAAETTPQAIWRYEAGESQPSIQMLERIVGALGISMAEFYGPAPKAKAKAS
jgi:transcriptional regulator with XRE-family HTH domain